MISLKYHGNFRYNSAVEHLNTEPKLLFRAAIYGKTERSQWAESLSIPSPAYTDPTQDPHGFLSQPGSRQLQLWGMAKEFCTTAKSPAVLFAHFDPVLSHL